MTTQEFLYTIPRAIYKEVAKDVNQLIGLSKTSSAIATLLTSLPMQVELRHISNITKPKKKLNSLNEFVHAYIKHDDASKLYIAFFYKNEKHLDRIAKAVDKHPEYFAYLYMREALKLTRLMNTKTHYQMMSGIIKHINPSIVVDRHYELSITACNIAVSNTIWQLFYTSPIRYKLDKILKTENVEITSLSETEIVKQLATDFDDFGDYIELDDSTAFNETTGQVFSTAGVDGQLPEDESIITNLGETLEKNFGSMSRGTGSAAIFGQLFEAKKVKTGWFKKLTAKFNRDVYYMTNSFTSEWSNFDITYRHKFKAPQSKYTDHKLSIVLSIDHSASVSTKGLQQLLYLISKQSKRITNLIVLIHDTEIVKEFNLSADYDIANDPQFKQALSSRFAVGGTSHIDVAHRIDELITTRAVDPNKTIYIAFSDFYSDVPEAIKKYPKVKLLNPIWLNPIDNPLPSECSGTNITMQ